MLNKKINFFSSCTDAWSTIEGEGGSGVDKGGGGASGGGVSCS